MNIKQWKQQAISTLFNSESPKNDVETLLSHVTGKERSWLLAFEQNQLEKIQLLYLNQLLAHRIKGEPIAYLIGKSEFWSFSLFVNDTTLIPRSDTEVLVEQSLEYLPATSSLILDLGTGTGAIALAIASERKDCIITGCDYIPDVILLAKKNAKQLNILNVNFQLSDWFSNLVFQRFELIVSNPPYIGINDEYLQQGDIRFEPFSALVSEDEGLADLRIIILTASKWLKSRGWLLLEHGWNQGEIVNKIMVKHGYLNVKTVKDYSGLARVTLGQFIH
ncbi:peptide chain release factor N(5)-glutamine methyltransferase [Pantoea sp. Mhis]|uniref:peptide chain release factor N(5)-glutamine methyltransferase n=1 Tax=Pantoea sp. Mhis TaxID=2576759 RepID=UPI001359DFA0|nr:peptide chain release factor N(5)-glutamine methyltransferase [Pantoea sp. Mhis]MXP56173.1 peptide chain release factor N(5)-glutamine methyltransferase [Pantoea sp. Mhis]